MNGSAPHDKSCANIFEKVQLKITTRLHMVEECVPVVHILHKCVVIFNKISLDFFKISFLFGGFLSVQTDKMPQKESKYKMVFKNFSCLMYLGALQPKQWAYTLWHSKFKHFFCKVITIEMVSFQCFGWDVLTRLIVY